MCLSPVLEPEDQGRPFTHIVGSHALPGFVGRQRDSISDQISRSVVPDSM